MGLVVISNETVFKYMGFLNGTIGKGLFLIFLASLAMGEMEDIYQMIPAGVMCLGAGVHFMRYCMTDDEKEAAAKDPELKHYMNLKNPVSV